MADEKIIQITEEQGYITALTNQGRIFISNGKSANLNLTWNEVVLPPLNKPKPRAQAKESAYSEDFIDFWSFYPKGHGGSKKEAYRQYKERVLEGFRIDGKDAPVHEQIMKGVIKYAGYIKATGQHVKHPATFLGRDKHYLNDYTIPESAKRHNRVKQEWEKIPENEHLIFDWAKKHSFKVNGQDSIFDTKRKIQAQIKQRIEQELN